MTIYSTSYVVHGLFIMTIWMSLWVFLVTEFFYPSIFWSRPLCCLILYLSMSWSLLVWIIGIPWIYSHLTWNTFHIWNKMLSLSTMIIQYRQNWNEMSWTRVARYYMFSKSTFLLYRSVFNLLIPLSWFISYLLKNDEWYSLREIIN